jgi:hypothetical protein
MLSNFHRIIHAIQSYVPGDVVDCCRDIALTKVQLPQAKILVLGGAHPHFPQLGQLPAEFLLQLVRWRDVVELAHHLAQHRLED